MSDRKPLGASYWKQQAGRHTTAISAEFRSSLICPDDDAPLDANAISGELGCPSCGRSYKEGADGVLTLLPTREPYQLSPGEIAVLSEAAAGAGEAVTPERLYDGLWPRIVEAMGPLEGRRVLDLCCGTGWASAWLASQGAKVAAGDVVEGEGGLRSAAAVRDAGASGFDLFRLDACRIPFANESFDIVFLSSCLYGMKRPERVIREVSRVLRADGMLINPGEPINRGGGYGVGGRDPRGEGRGLSMADYQGIYQEGELELTAVSENDAPGAKPGFFARLTKQLITPHPSGDVFFVGRKPAAAQLPELRLPWRKKEKSNG